MEGAERLHRSTTGDVCCRNRLARRYNQKMYARWSARVETEGYHLGTQMAYERPGRQKVAREACQVLEFTQPNAHISEYVSRACDAVLNPPNLSFSSNLLLDPV